MAADLDPFIAKFIMERNQQLLLLMGPLFLSSLGI